MKKVIGAAVVAALAMVLAGCGPTKTPSGAIEVGGTATYQTFESPYGGNDLLCLLVREGHGLGVSCDWRNQ